MMCRCVLLLMRPFSSAMTSVRGANNTNKEAFQPPVGDENDNVNVVGEVGDNIEQLQHQNNPTSDDLVLDVDAIVEEKVSSDEEDEVEENEDEEYIGGLDFD
ncbi:hypothetical protein RJT34_11344 [Clitoria ternatea]|uniref:Uncharacterized protein n=1 Tax=Clitoria ternatea TaxID=43366 RepID=A0AAN9PJZ8_CLITE